MGSLAKVISSRLLLATYAVSGHMISGHIVPACAIPIHVITGHIASSCAVSRHIAVTTFTTHIIVRHVIAGRIRRLPSPCAAPGSHRRVSRCILITVLLITTLKREACQHDCRSIAAIIWMVTTEGLTFVATVRTKLTPTAASKLLCFDPMPAVVGRFCDSIWASLFVPYQILRQPLATRPPVNTIPARRVRVVFMDF